MTAEEIISGKSLNVVFTKSLPDINEKLLKTIVAFANSSGGKLIIGVEDETRKIIGVDTAEVYPGSSRPYYLKALGKKYGTYIRAAGTTCPADPQMIHDLDCKVRINPMTKQSSSAKSWT